MDNLTIGDLVPSGTICFEDNDDYTIWMTRDGDKIHIRTDYKNVKALLDANAAEAAEFNATGSHGDLVKLANIPVGLYFDWSRQGITGDPEAIKRRLNDSDYAKLRVNNWRI